MHCHYRPVAPVARVRHSSRAGAVDLRTLRYSSLFHTDLTNAKNVNRSGGVVNGLNCLRALYCHYSAFRMNVSRRCSCSSELIGVQQQSLKTWSATYSKTVVCCMLPVNCVILDLQASGQLSREKNLHHKISLYICMHFVHPFTIAEITSSLRLQ